jgi:transcriptional regulator with XRE-family HTH domain
MKRMGVREARERLDWTQKDLEAEARRVDPDGVGVSQGQISNIETGVIGDPLHSTVEILERALRVPPGTLLFGEAITK